MDSATGYTVPEFFGKAASEQRDNPFIVFKGRELSYGEVDKRSRQFAAGLQGKGLKIGSRVAVKLNNCPEFVVAWLGTAMAGLIFVPINPQYKYSETSQIFDHCKPRVFVSSSRLVDRMSERPNLTTLLVDDQDRTFEEFGAHSNGEPNAANVKPDDPLVIIYTSGTTGAPKGVVQSHKTYCLTGRAFPRWLGLRASDRLLTCLPLNHINAQAYSVMGAVGARASVAILERFSLSRFWDEAGETRSTQFNAVGAMLMMFYENSVESRTDHDVHTIYSAPTLPERVRSAVERRYDVKVVFGYGLSECTFGFIEVPTDSRREGSMGKPRSYPGFPNDVKIMDSEGKEASPSHPGEVLLRNEAVMTKYYRDAKRTKATLAGGWLHTGDIGYRDEEGYYYFVSRASDLARRKGENVYLAEIEATINSNLSVGECAAVAIPSRYSDDEIIAFVVPKARNSVSAEEIQEWCRARLAEFKVPEVFIMNSPLPRTPTFRIDKGKLRASALSSRRGDRMQGERVRS